MKDWTEVIKDMPCIMNGLRHSILHEFAKYCCPVYGMCTICEKNKKECKDIEYCNCKYTIERMLELFE